MMVFLVVFFCMLLAFVVSTVISWIVISRRNYSSDRLEPNKPYRIGDRTYRCPNMRVVGDAFLIKPEFAHSLRDLFKRTIATLEDAGLGKEWWCTGGTLMGALIHGSVPLPTDDDIDIAVEYKHKDLLFSERFQDIANEHGIQAIRLAPNTKKTADRNGAAVRLQHLKSKYNDTLDIFFWQRKGDKIIKVDGWRNGHTVDNKKEIFDQDNVFPLHCGVEVDGIENVNLPQDGRALLNQQYSKEVWSTYIARPLLVSHTFPYVFLKHMWVPTNS